MNSVIDNIKNLEKNFQIQSEHIELSKFYEEMKRLGLVKEPEYTIPMIDTIGKTSYKNYFFPLP